VTDVVGGQGVRELFDANAETYDRVNSIVSFGLDRFWRRWVARKAVEGDVVRARVLDAFAGTGLVGLETAALGALVTLADESPGMLSVAQRRARRRGLQVGFVMADLTSVSRRLPASPFDAITIAFGVRYLQDPATVIRGLSAILRPRGKVILLDFCEPRPGPVASVAAFYFFHVLPRIAGLLAGDRQLYDMLTATTRALGGPDSLPALAVEAGLEVVETRTMGFGLVVGVVARRP
jgi:demethylmenaquinone methyltransferase/2-methoxy-6-polyprenyl-1,4-benzoquinol methylase